MNSPQYRFFLQAGSTDTLHAANPVYGGNLALNYELEREQRFFRAKLSGKLTFLRGDYDRIMAASFGTVFYLTMQRATDAAGTVYADYYKAKFTITDCTVDMDDKTVQVQPQTTDRYDDILAGLSNEYNLIELQPAMALVSAYKRPMVQVYQVGEDFLNCYIAGTTWEQDCTGEDDKDRLGTHFYFGLDSIFILADVTNPTYAGRYRGVVKRASYSSDTETFTGTLTYITGTSQYYIEVNITCYGCNYGSKWYGNMYLKTGDTILYTCTVGTLTDMNDFDSGNYVFEGDNDDFAIYFTNTFMMARWLTDVTSQSGLTLYDLPKDDIGDVNRNYHKCARVSLGTFYISTNTSSTPTEYGVANSAGTLYYAPPTELPTDWYLPVEQSLWEDSVSYWFYYSAVFQMLEDTGRAAYQMRNAYPLWSCIKALLSQVAPNVTFEGTSTYSEVLYGSTNPMGDGQQIRLFCTPKSNVLAGDYSTPAQKAMTTLGKFLDMLRNMYQCYWFIDDSNRLRIEHISWFKNGGTYSQAQQIGIDLTTMLERRNDTAWTYGVNQYSYEKETMTQRYQFEWMDDARIPFMGEPIEVLSPAVEEGKVETVTIGAFSSDLDYMLLNPSVFSQDGFALLGVKYQSSQWVVPFTSYTRNGLTITLQNGYLAMYYIQYWYWLYDMPAKSVKVNGNTYTLTNVARRKQQKVSAPMGGDDVDFLKLVKTGLGNGEIRAVSLPLTSRVAQITLNYDTE